MDLRKNFCTLEYFTEVLAPRGCGEEALETPRSGWAGPECCMELQVSLLSMGEWGQVGREGPSQL